MATSLPVVQQRAAHSGGRSSVSRPNCAFQNKHSVQNECDRLLQAKFPQIVQKSARNAAEEYNPHWKRVNGARRRPVHMGLSGQLRPNLQPEISYPGGWAA